MFLSSTIERIVLETVGNNATNNNTGRGDIRGERGMNQQKNISANFCEFLSGITQKIKILLYLSIDNLKDFAYSQNLYHKCYRSVQTWRSSF